MSAAIQYARPWNQRGSGSAKTTPHTPPQNEIEIRAGTPKGLVGFMSKGGTGIIPARCITQNKIWWKTGTASVPAMKASTRVAGDTCALDALSDDVLMGFSPHKGAAHILLRLCAGSKSTRAMPALGRRPACTDNRQLAACRQAKSTLLGFRIPAPEICHFVCHFVDSGGNSARELPSGLLRVNHQTHRRQQRAAIRPRDRLAGRAAALDHRSRTRHDPAPLLSLRPEYALSPLVPPVPSGGVDGRHEAERLDL